jgi:hypothetical protein
MANPTQRGPSVHNYLEPPVDPIAAMAQERIRRHGWAVQSVAHPRAPWSYTVGLSDRGHPELVVVGAAPAAAGGILNSLGKALFGTGVDLESPEAIQHLLGLPMPYLQTCPVHPTWAESSLFNTAWRVYGRIPTARQVVLADSDGRWPWEERFAMARVQPALWEPWPGSAAWPDGDTAEPIPIAAAIQN